MKTAPRPPAGADRDDAREPLGHTQEPATSTVMRRLAAGTTIAATVIATATLSASTAGPPATADPSAVHLPALAVAVGDPAVDRQVSDRAARAARTRERTRGDTRPDNRPETSPPAAPKAAKSRPAKSRPAAKRHPKPAAAVPVAGPVDGSRVNTVVAYARAQVGKRYVRNAAGPNSFDCSGLTLAAYAQIGISLPHFTGDQVDRGRPVGRAELQPGDLVFPASGHVGIYVGGGLMVHASTPRGGVKLSTVYAFWTARRIL